MTPHKKLTNAVAYLRLSVTYRRVLLNAWLHKWGIHVRGIVLDVGGIKDNPVGFAPPEQSSVRRWIYVNISPAHMPDILADGAHIPLATESIDTVVCLETLEHVPDPLQIMRELSRVLRPTGVLLLSVPFLLRIHSAPNDFWRFTEYQIQRMADETGLKVVCMARLGQLFTVLCDMIKQATSEIRPTPLRWGIGLMLLPLTTSLVCLERLGLGRGSAVLARFTTGYLAMMRKAAKSGSALDQSQAVEEK